MRRFGSGAALTRRRRPERQLEVSPDVGRHVYGCHAPGGLPERWRALHGMRVSAGAGRREGETRGDFGVGHGLVKEGVGGLYGLWLREM
jgi:hypothetical protein